MPAAYTACPDAHIYHFASRIRAFAAELIDATMMGNDGRISAANIDLNDQWFSHVRSDLWSLADNVRTKRRITRRARRAASRPDAIGIENQQASVPEVIWAGPGIVRSSQRDPIAYRPHHRACRRWL